MVKSRQIAEYGDFQTPPELARAVCNLLVRQGVAPQTVIEPTCGLGSFLFASKSVFGEARKHVGFEINPDYVRHVKQLIEQKDDARDVQIDCQDFFDVNWDQALEKLSAPLLVIGNPPWVTNAELGTLGSKNLPEKSNFHRRQGLDARTGKSNFDISEWMLLRLIECLDERDATLAMLCKTAVARKTLAYGWKRRIRFAEAAIYRIDALQQFSAAVDACLLMVRFSGQNTTAEAQVYDELDSQAPSRTVGFAEGALISNMDALRKWRHLAGVSQYKWRSGVKHDCAKVMEFRAEGELLQNGLGEQVQLDDSYVYPLLKGTDLAKQTDAATASRFALLTQKTPQDDTASLEYDSPETWRYLLSHAELLDARRSSIYRNRHRFAIFGVGPYTFAPWKVAIPALYKSLAFSVIGPCDGKPVVVDDTSYFVPCDSEEEAIYLADLLNSEPAREFYSAFIFWDSKRPITVELLKRLDLEKLEIESGEPGRLREFLPRQFAQAELF